jgi:hypothetical protein
MKAKKATPSRRRISFAVDREEIEINSDWVEAVMAISPPPRAVVPFPAPPVAPPEEQHDSAPVFFAPDENSATVAEDASDAGCTSVEESSAVVENAPVVNLAAVVGISSVEKDSPVADSATVAIGATERTLEPTAGAAASISPVEESATGANNSSVAKTATGERLRAPRPRPIVRVTDGLTPGQYAVYSLMYEAGEGSDGGSRIYKGGYADLGRLTGLSKRGLQNIISELQTKRVIQLHQQPGYHRTETSAYLVPPPGVVLEVWFSQGWRHALGKSKTLAP